MTSNDDLDRRLTAQLVERAAPLAPHGLSEATTERIEGTRQLPAWATTERWISMETRAQLGTVPRTALILATVVLLTVLAAGAIFAGSSAPTLPTPFGPASNGPIAYSSGGDIWLTSADDGTTTALTSGGDFYREPAWSLDGALIAYASLVGDTYDVVIAKADGTDAVTVASGLGSDPGFVHWKPDSSAVAFATVDESVIGDECGDIWSGVCGSRLWVAAADGSSLEQIGRADLDAAAPAWSPDGSRIVFAGRVLDGPGELFGLYLMNADGSDVQRLGDITGPPGRSLYWQHWSPDGTRIATQTIPDVVYAVDVETGDATEMTRGPHADFPVWSNDGHELAVSNMQVGGVIVREDGSELAIDAMPVGYLHWSPDGQTLVGATEFGPEAIHLFDLSGELVRSIETAGRGTGAIDFQRLAP